MAKGIRWASDRLTPTGGSLDGFAAATGLRAVSWAALYAPVPTSQSLLPVNSSVVARPGWLMPSRVMTFHTVTKKILTSSQNDQ